MTQEPLEQLHAQALTLTAAIVDNKHVSYVLLDSVLCHNVLITLKTMQ